MLITLISESGKSLTPVILDGEIINNEKLLRAKLLNLAKEADSCCYWKPISQGGLTAYFCLPNKVECRTYSNKEITDLLFENKKIFHFTAIEILTMLEETLNLMVKDPMPSRIARLISIHGSSTILSAA